MGFLTKSDEVTQNSNWSNLPRDIAESILKRLCLQDYLQFGEVCKSWQTIVADAIASKQCRPAPLAQLPLMIASRAENLKAFSLTTKKLIHPKRPLFTKNHHCLGTIEGWLIMFDSSLWRQVANNASIDPNSSPFFFLNTVSNVRISLASELTIPQQVNFENYPFDRMVASSSPSSKDCFIAGRFDDCQHLAFCMLNDNSWNIIKLKNANKVILDIEILNNKLYVLARQARERLIEAYDLQNPNTTKVQVLPLPAFHEVMSDNRIMGNISHVSKFSMFFLGKNHVSRELLLIRGLYDFSFYNEDKRMIGHSAFVQKFIHPPFSREFRVWKYKYNDSQWIEIDNLGDCSIFLGNNGLTVISVNHLTRQELVERNFIYFAHWKNSSDFDSVPCKLEVGIFSLIDQSMKYFAPTDMNNFLTRSHEVLVMISRMFG